MLRVNNKYSSNAFKLIVPESGSFYSEEYDHIEPDNSYIVDRDFFGYIGWV